LPATCPRLAFTPGEPAGIGPDLCVQLAQQSREVEVVAICDPDLLQARARALSLPLRLRLFEPDSVPAGTHAGECCVQPVALRAPAQAGVLDRTNARYVLDTLDHAIAGCQSGRFAAMVTGPVHKGIINDAGIPFSGHTEYIASATHTDHVVMLLAAGTLRVALATTHVPLSEVSALITQERLQRVIRILHDDLVKRFGIERPRIRVCGLNPHAGEDGHLGREELDIMIPALQALRAEGLSVAGPLPADTAFTTASLAQCDAILAMYHDQGLPVLKHASFGRAINVTLGLPIIRTSVDHGTALELAGTGRADTGSLEAALTCAVEMVKRTLKLIHVPAHPV
jgi:4-hydroxythreonine-4-phosphate dehydrogenase